MITINSGEIFFFERQERINSSPYNLELTSYKQSLVKSTLKKKPFENIMGKEENAGNQHFVLFLQCFLPYQRQKLLFKQY